MLICSSRAIGRVSLANAGGCLLSISLTLSPQKGEATSSTWSQTSSPWNAARPSPNPPATRRAPPAGSSFQTSTMSTFDTPALANPQKARSSINLPPNASQLAQLRALIAAAEAGSADYNAVQYQARFLPPKKPTQMTIAEIFAWIEATPGQHHAIGRYQIIPATLAGLVRNSGISSTTPFTPDTQDLFANMLIEEAGYHRFRRGQISRAAFMDSLAAIWAGFPLPNGQSRYQGIAGNKATITREAFENAMEKIFPTQQAQNAPESPSAPH